MDGGCGGAWLPAASLAGDLWRWLPAKLFHLQGTSEGGSMYAGWLFSQVLSICEQMGPMPTATAPKDSISHEWAKNQYHVSGCARCIGAALLNSFGFFRRYTETKFFSVWNSPACSPNICLFVFSRGLTETRSALSKFNGSVEFGSGDSPTPCNFRAVNGALLRALRRTLNFNFEKPWTTRF